jgi:hypothetical protein
MYIYVVLLQSFIRDRKNLAADSEVGKGTHRHHGGLTQIFSLLRAERRLEIYLLVSILFAVLTGKYI